MPSPECFTFTETDGLVAFDVDLGERVRKGDVLARIYSIGQLGTVPIEHHARLDGILAARHVPGLVAIGDCLTVTATVL
jgi:N-alpha-acetyl-L-2,4-diaminobutyrate deacetylase